MKKNSKRNEEALLLQENYPTETTVGNQARRGRKTSRARARSDPAQALPTGEELHQRIAERAYELYLQRGQVHGHDLDDWFEAERLVLPELKAPSENPPTKPKRPVRRSKEIRG